MTEFGCDFWQAESTLSPEHQVMASYTTPQQSFLVWADFVDHNRISSIKMKERKKALKQPELLNTIDERMHSALEAEKPAKPFFLTTKTQLKERRGGKTSFYSAISFDDLKIPNEFVHSIAEDLFINDEGLNVEEKVSTVICSYDRLLFI